MCGILGILSSTLEAEDEARLLAMRGAIAHRGPDDAGHAFVPEAGVALAHVRLSILDLSAAGHQPMVWGDGAFTIVFNGEIYNYAAIRADLEAMGHRFRTGTDTEVILAGYAAWGEAVLERLNGMFAFALYDRAQGRAWFARDRLGVKPLYYHHNPATGLFLFASEAKALLAHPAVPRAVDAAGLECYLRLGYVPAPHSIMAGIRKLPAAHAMTVVPGQAPVMRRYWTVAVGTDRDASEAELIGRLRERFEASVKHRMISDVPVGAFLSGGVDSTLVVGAMSRLTEAPVRTFSAAFEVGARSAKYNVDADMAEEVARHYGTAHSRFVITPETDLLHHLRRAVRHMDEPHANATNLTTLLLAEQIKAAGITVVLSGDGGDEIFGGYERYQRDWQLEWLRRVPGPLRALGGLPGIERLPGLSALPGALAKAGLAPFTAERLLTWWGVFPADALARLVADGHRSAGEPERLAAACAALGPAPTHQDLMLLFDLLQWIPEESNMRMDKMTMAAALESRAPFLDYRLVEAAMAIPFHRKVGWGQEKRLQKAAFADLLPAAVRDRPKWGWFSPIHYWVRDFIWSEAQALIRDLPKTGVFTPAVAEVVAGPPPGNPQQVWALLTFALWYDEFMRVPAATGGEVVRP